MDIPHLVYPVVSQFFLTVLFQSLFKNPLHSLEAKLPIKHVVVICFKIQRDEKCQNQMAGVKPFVRPSQEL